MRGLGRALCEGGQGGKEGVPAALMGESSQAAELVPEHLQVAETGMVDEMVRAGLGFLLLKMAVALGTDGDKVGPGKMGKLRSQAPGAQA